MTSPAGMNRKASAYAKNGSVASQTSEKRLRPERVSGRSALEASACVASCRPQIVGHSAAIFAFAAVCCASLANFTFA
jgi:hypothetical protein